MLAPQLDHSFQVLTPEDTGWDHYVQQHPQGSIFHTSAMIRAFAATPELTPWAWAASNASGKIVALLVSVHVKTLSRWPALSSRAVQYAAPLCDATPEGVSALKDLLQRHDDALRSQALFCEVRSLGEPGHERIALCQSGYEHLDYLNYVVELQGGEAALWQQVDKRMRQKIRGTLRKQIRIADDNTPAGVARLYQILRSSYGRVRVPLLSQDLFAATLAYLPSQCVRIRTAYDGSQPVASIISLVYKGRVFSWYGGTQRLRGLSPFACIVWDDIAWGAQQQQQLYDFGGAGWPHEDYGPRRFKASFGGRRVCYGRYQYTYSRLRLKMAELAYGASRRLGAWSAGVERETLDQGSESC